jgi:hypothetical protein
MHWELGVMFLSSFGGGDRKGGGGLQATDRSPLQFIILLFYAILAIYEIF